MQEKEGVQGKYTVDGIGTSASQQPQGVSPRGPATQSSHFVLNSQQYHEAQISTRLAECQAHYQALLARLQNKSKHTRGCSGGEQVMRGILRAAVGGRGGLWEWLEGGPARANGQGVKGKIRKIEGDVGGVKRVGKEARKPSIFRVVQLPKVPTPESVTATQRAVLDRQYLEQLANPCRHFNRLFECVEMVALGSGVSLPRAKLEGQAVSYRQISNKFVKNLLGNISRIKSQLQSLPVDFDKDRCITKVLASHFAKSLNKPQDQHKLQIRKSSSCAFGNRAAKFSFIRDVRAHLQKINLTLLSLTANLEARISRHAGNSQRQQKNSLEFIGEICRQLRRKCQENIELPTVSSKNLEDFMEYMVQEFKKNQLFEDMRLSEEETTNLRDFLQQIEDKFKNKRHEQVSAKVTGKIVYKVQQKISNISQTEQAWLKAVYKFIINRRQQQTNQAKIKKIPYMQVPVQIPREPYPEKKPHLSKPRTNRDEIQIIKKIRVPASMGSGPSRPIVNYIKNPKLILNQPASEMHKSAVSMNLFESRAVRNTKKSKQNKTQDMKKLQFNEYVQSLKRDNSTEMTRYKLRPDTISSAATSELMARSPPRKKLIKYNKYPMYFNNVEFASEDTQNCHICYRLPQINLKDLHMSFMRDRRRYSINKVKIFIPFGLNIERQDYVKLVKSMQILNCLGAQVVVQEERPYENRSPQGSSIVELLAFALKQNVQKIYSAYQEQRE